VPFLAGDDRETEEYEGMKKAYRGRPSLAMTAVCAGIVAGLSAPVAAQTTLDGAAGGISGTYYGGNGAAGNGRGGGGGGSGTPGNANTVGDPSVNGVGGTGHFATNGGIGFGGAGGGVGATAIGGTSIVGGDGSTGSPDFSFGGGGGGGGGAGVFSTASVLTNSGISITGGKGGMGGNAGGYVSGGGGGGGAGVVSAAAGARFDNAGSVEGGRGGDGAPANFGSSGGGGGDGVLLLGGGVRFTNALAGVARGGTGGSGTVTTPAGAGGAAVRVGGDGNLVVNAGALTGGTGGSAGVGGAGAGGAGLRVEGNDNRVVNTGLISGGVSGTGGRGNAVEVVGDRNGFELQAGAVVTGTLQVTGADNVLLLGGDVTDATTSAAADAYAGFARYEKTGASTWTLTGSISGPRSWTVSAGTLRAGAANVLSAASAHAVTAGGTLDLAGFDQTVAGLSNGGTVSLIGATPGTTLTVTGAYVGNNGLLKLGTALGDSGSASDRLILSGTAASASGRTAVQVTNIGGLGALTSGNGIELISAVGGATTTAQSTKDAFSLAGGHVDAGAYEYRLYAADANGAGEGWYLRSAIAPPPEFPVVTVPTYRAEVPLFAALPAQLRQAGLGMLGNLHQRMGDDDAAAGGGPRRAWGRVISTDIDLRQAGTVSPGSQGRLTGFQAGTDLWADAGWHAGVYVGQLDGDVDVDGFARGITNLRVGRSDLRSRYLGAYGTYADGSGFYADAVIQAARHSYDVQPDLGVQASGEGHGLLASIELGQSFAIAARWKIEPQLQLVHQRLSLDDTQILGAQVRQDTDDGWLARVGVRVKGEFATAAGTLQPYARLNVYRASGGEDVARFIGPAASTDIATRTGGTSTEVAAGATLQLSAATSVYGEVGKLYASGGEETIESGVQGSVGLRVRW
jgi:outer membrane autotransporter protein